MHQRIAAVDESWGCLLSLRFGFVWGVWMMMVYCGGLFTAHHLQELLISSWYVCWDEIALTSHRHVLLRHAVPYQARHPGAVGH